MSSLKKQFNVKKKKFKDIFKEDNLQCDTFNSIFPFFIHMSSLINEKDISHIEDRNFPILCSDKYFELSGSLVTIFLEDIHKIFENEDKKIKELYNIIKN